MRVDPLRKQRFVGIYSFAPVRQIMISSFLHWKSNANTVGGYEQIVNNSKLVWVAGRCTPKIMKGLLMLLK